MEGQREPPAIGRRRATTVVAIALAAAALAASLPSSQSPASAGKRFSAYPSCTGGGGKPDRFCFVGDRPVSVLRAFGRAGVPYRICVRGGDPSPRCKRRRTDEPGRRSRVPFDLDGPGKYKLVWFVNGRPVDRDKIVVRRRAVLHIGDSVGVGTRPYLPNALSDWRVSQSVRVGRHVPEALAILRRRGGLPGVIVMAVGGNDDPRHVSTFEDAVAATRRIAGPTRCVVWPNIVSRTIAGTTFAGYNAVLDRFDRRRRNFRVVNWVAIVRRHPGWLAADGIHVNATGYRARARAIAKQVRRC